MKSHPVPHQIDQDHALATVEPSLNGATLSPPEMPQIDLADGSQYERGAVKNG